MPLVIVISLVYAGTRDEKNEYILAGAGPAFGTWICCFMFAIFVILALMLCTLSYCAAGRCAGLLTAEFTGISLGRVPSLSCLRFAALTAAVAVLACACLTGYALARRKISRRLPKPRGPRKPRAASWSLPRIGRRGSAADRGVELRGCHLTAGGELTDAAIFFARSVHDLQGLTCYDCHGGNREDDARAHEEAFGLIGTKLSALEGVQRLPRGRGRAVVAGRHHWDFSKRVNTQFPTCIDCHGNHDIGNPPADFKLVNMCLDCHHKLEKEFPQIASVVTGVDQLADVMREVRKKTIHEANPVPEPFREDLAGLRTDTMAVIHGSKEITAEEGAGIERAERQNSHRIAGVVKIVQVNLAWRL